jgi:outer membrane PBP1 activator LpoA protein
MRLISPLKSVICLLAVFALAACAPQQRHADMSAELAAQPAAPTDTGTALARLENLSSPVREQRLLAWSGEYLANGNLQAAATLLDSREPRKLDGNLRLRWVLLRAQVHLAEEDIEPALELLSSERLEIDRLMADAPETLRNRIQLLRADALTLDGQLAASLQERVAAHPLLGDEDRDYNREMIWSLLMHLPMAELRDMAGNARGDLRGWSELALLFRDPLVDIDTQARELSQWQSRWSDHPASRHMPNMVTALNRAARKRPEHVAVLLPLTGPLSQAGESIRDGLLTGYYSALAQGHPVPTLRFYDTGSDDVINLYNQSTQDGAQFVIGPLNKEQVNRLASVDRLPVTTLALNYVERDQVPANLYQFGLAPEDEARQVAEHFQRENIQLAGVLYPDSDWGRRVAQTFVDHFVDQGGLISTQQAYAGNETDAVSKLFNIGQSHQRARELNRLTSHHIQFEPRRRQDVDALFLVANAEQARQVKPALNFHYASDLRVYATSHVYAGVADPGRDHDLNGIRFVDLPWLLDSGSSLHELADTTWPSGHGQMERLFALGVDAYRLQARLLMLQSVPESRLPGVTGRLQVGQQQHLVRELDWAFFSGGKPQRLPVVAGSKKTVKEDDSEEMAEGARVLQY